MAKQQLHSDNEKIIALRHCLETVRGTIMYFTHTFVSEDPALVRQMMRDVRMQLNSCAHAVSTILGDGNHDEEQ